MHVLAKDPTRLQQEEGRGRESGVPGLEEGCRPAEEQAAREAAAEAALQPAEVSSGLSGPDPGDTTSVGRRWA